MTEYEKDIVDMKALPRMFNPVLVAEIERLHLENERLKKRVDELLTELTGVETH